MSIETFGHAEAEHRPLMRSIGRGLVSRCPRCGEGSLFASWLRPVERCGTCHEDYTPQRADDLPPYLTIFIVGHLVVAGYMAGETWLDLDAWGHLAIWAPITLILSLVLIRPFKGGTIGLQWALRMHGFGDGEPDDAERADASTSASDRRSS